MSKVQVVWFRELDLWDFKSNHFDKNIFINSNFPLVCINEFLTRNKTGIVVDNNQTYKRITIKGKGGGVVVRDILRGKDIGVKKQFIIQCG